MKTLIFVRHGKSSWDYQVGDKDRPLKERGINDAHLIAEKLKALQIAIDFAFSSPANRALHTAMIFLRTLRHDFDKFKVTEDLYDFSGESVLQFIKGLDDKLETVLIFGHNYAFTSLANALGDRYLDNVPTSGLVAINFNVKQWNGIEKGETSQVLFPKQLR